ncbi:hypothetical protein FOA52_012713 [Chlamydomonas sp. UWO 241]|nr:hypothetical protein FOA52_012713 [Chlamydomonas sp. UWO 241]
MLAFRSIPQVRGTSRCARGSPLAPCVPRLYALVPVPTRCVAREAAVSGREWVEAGSEGAAGPGPSSNGKASAVPDAAPTRRSSGGRAGGRGRGGRGRGESRGVVLPESDPMYAPALTDEDLDADPPGHKSGYVAVIGKPNAGKSTLINAIVGQKLSIVSPKAQTTRHRIVGIASEKEYQMILFDTPGIIEEKRNKLEERMMSAVISSIQNSEAIIAVVDSSHDPQDALAMFQPGENWTGPPMAVLLNKSDLLTAEQLAELVDWYKTACKAEAVFTGSALNNEGVVALKAWAAVRLPEGPTLYPKTMVSEQPERFFVAEIVREKIFLLYQREIPYSCQVQIKDFKERRTENKVYVQATVLVERESQKGILIGKGGAALKKLGQTARTDIEKFLDREVFLELSVEVSESWRTSKKALEEYGYFDSMYT